MPKSNKKKRPTKPPMSATTMQLPKPTAGIQAPQNSFEEIQLEDYQIRYGKYKDQKLKDIDPNYLRYLTKLPDYNDIAVIEYVESLGDPPYIFRFGKYKNKRLDQVYKVDPKYLFYLKTQEWFKDKKIVDEFLVNQEP